MRLSWGILADVVVEAHLETGIEALNAQRNWLLLEIWMQNLEKGWTANSADLENFCISEETPWVNMRYPPITWHDMTWRDFMLSFGTQCGRRVHRRPLNSTVLSFWLDLAFRSHVTWWHVERWYENCLLFTEADNMEADRRGFQGSWYEFAVLEWMPGRHMFISFFCKLVEPMQLCTLWSCGLFLQ